MQHYTPGSGPRLHPQSTLPWGTPWPPLRHSLIPLSQGHPAAPWQAQSVRGPLFPSAPQPQGFSPRIHLANPSRLRNPGFIFQWRACPQITQRPLSHRQVPAPVGMGRDGGEDRWRGHREERGVHRVPSTLLGRDMVREKYQREPLTSISDMRKEADYKGAMMAKEKVSRTLHVNSSQPREKSVERNREKDVKPNRKNVEVESKVKDSSRSRDSTSPLSCQNCVTQSKSTCSNPSASSSKGDSRDGSICHHEDSKTSDQPSTRDTSSSHATASATASKSKCQSSVYQTVMDKNPVVVLERLPEWRLNKYMKRSVSPAESCPEGGLPDEVPSISERPRSAPSSSSLASSEVKASDFESLSVKKESGGVGKSVSEKLGAHGAFEIDPRVKNLSRPLQRACSSGKDASELTFNVPKIQLAKWSSRPSNKNLFFVKHNDLDKLRTKLTLAKLGARKPKAKSSSHPSKRKTSNVESMEEERGLKVDTSGGSSSASRLSCSILKKEGTKVMDSFQRYLDENQETLTSSDSSDQEEDAVIEPGQSESKRPFKREDTFSANDNCSQDSKHMTDGKTMSEEISGENEKRNNKFSGSNTDVDKVYSCPLASPAGESSSDDFESVHSSCSPPFDVASESLALPSISVQCKFSRDISPLARKSPPVQTLSKSRDSSLTNEGAPLDSLPSSGAGSKAESESRSDVDDGIAKKDSGISIAGNDVPDTSSFESADAENLKAGEGISVVETQGARKHEVPGAIAKVEPITVWKDKLLAAEFSPSSQSVTVSEPEGYQLDTDHLEVASFEEVSMKEVTSCEDVGLSVEGELSANWLYRAISESKWSYGETETMSALTSEVEAAHTDEKNGEKQEHEERSMPVLSQETYAWKNERGVFDDGSSGGETASSLFQDAGQAEDTEGCTMDSGDVSDQAMQPKENQVSDASLEETGLHALDCQLTSSKGPVNSQQGTTSSDALSGNHECHPEALTLSLEVGSENKSDKLKDVEVPQVSLTENADSPRICGENLSVGEQEVDQLTDGMFVFMQDCMHTTSTVCQEKPAQVVFSTLSDCEDNSNNLIIDEGTECSQERLETPSEPSLSKGNTSVGNDKLESSHEHNDQGKGMIDIMCKGGEDAPQLDLLPTANCLGTRHQPNGSWEQFSAGSIENKDQSTAVTESSPDGHEKVSGTQSPQRTCSEDAVANPSAFAPVALAAASEEHLSQESGMDHPASTQTGESVHGVTTAVPSDVQNIPSACISSAPSVAPRMTTASVSIGIQQQAPLPSAYMASKAYVTPAVNQTALVQQQTSHVGVLNLSVKQPSQSQRPPQLITTANCPVVLQVGNFLTPVCSGVLLTSSIPARTARSGLTEVTLVQSLTSQTANSTSGINSLANGLILSDVVVRSKPGSNPGSFVPRVAAPVTFPVQFFPIQPTLPPLRAREPRKERPILPAIPKNRASSSSPTSVRGATNASGGGGGSKVEVEKTSHIFEPSSGEDSELGLVITSVRGGVDAEAAALEVDDMPHNSSEGGPSEGNNGGTSSGTDLAQSTVPGSSISLQVASSTQETQSNSAPIAAAARLAWSCRKSVPSKIGLPPPLVRLGETSVSSGQSVTSNDASALPGRQPGTGAFSASSNHVQAPASMVYEASVSSGGHSDRDKRNNNSGLQQRAEISSPPGPYSYVLPQYLQEQVASIVNMSPSHCSLQNSQGGFDSPRLLAERSPLDGLLDTCQVPYEEQDISVGATMTVETQDFSAFNLSPTNKRSTWAAAPVEPRDHLRLPVIIAPNIFSVLSEKPAQLQQLGEVSSEGKVIVIKEDPVAAALKGEAKEQGANDQDLALDSHQGDNIERQDQQNANRPPPDRGPGTVSEVSPMSPLAENASSGEGVEFPIEVDIDASAATPGEEMNSPDSYETDSTMTYSCDEDALVKLSSSPPVIRCYRKSEVPTHADDFNQNSIIASKSAQQKAGPADEDTEEICPGKRTAVKGKSRKGSRKQGRRLKRKHDDPNAKVQFRIIKKNAEHASEGIVLRKLNRRSCRENKIVVTNAMMVQSENGMLGTIFSSDEEITDPESPPPRSPPPEDSKEFTQESVMRELGLTKCSDGGKSKVKGWGLSSRSSDLSGRKIRASTRSQRRQWAPRECESSSRERNKSLTDGTSEGTASPPLEEMDSEELPRIHPPKRRRCSQGKSDHGGLTQNGGLNMQDAVPGPARGGSSSSERIMREFPRHNWLEQKIQQLSSGPQLGYQGESASSASSSAPRKMPAPDTTGSLDELSPSPGNKSLGSTERLNQKATVASGRKLSEGTHQAPGELESNDYKNKLRRRYPAPETNSHFAKYIPTSLEREEKEMASIVACDSDKTLREEQSCRKPSQSKDSLRGNKNAWHEAKKANKDTAPKSSPGDDTTCITKAEDAVDAQLKKYRVSDASFDEDTDCETGAPESVPGVWETSVDSQSALQPSSKGTSDRKLDSVDNNQWIHSSEAGPIAQTSAFLARHTAGLEGSINVGAREVENTKEATVETASGTMSVSGASDLCTGPMVGSEGSKEDNHEDLHVTQVKMARMGNPNGTDAGLEPRSDVDASSQDASYQDGAPLDLCTKKQHLVLPSPRTRAHPPPVQLVHPQVQQPVPLAPSAPSPNTLIQQTKIALSNVQVIIETPDPQRAAPDAVQISCTEDPEKAPLSLTLRGASERKDESSSPGKSRPFIGVSGLSGRSADSELKEGSVLDAAMVAAVSPGRTEPILLVVSKAAPISGDGQTQTSQGAQFQRPVDGAEASFPSAMETSDSGGEDLDPEYERQLQELRELEELAARKEKEREEVLSMRKRKAEMIRSMEEQRKRMKLSAGSAGTSQQMAAATTPEAMDTSSAHLTSSTSSSVSGSGMLNAPLLDADARLSFSALTASWTTSSGSGTFTSSAAVSSGGTASATSSQFPLGVHSMRLPVSIAVHPSNNVPVAKSGSVIAGTNSVSTITGVPSTTMRAGGESTTLVPSSSAGRGRQAADAGGSQPSDAPALPAPLSTIVSLHSSAATGSATPGQNSMASSRLDAKVTTATSCRSSTSVSGDDATKSSVAQGGISQLPVSQEGMVGVTPEGLTGTQAAAPATDRWRPLVHVINKAMQEKARQSENCAMEEGPSETNKDMAHRSRSNSTSGSAEGKTTDADRTGPPAIAHQHQSSTNTKVHLGPVPPFIKNSCPYLARSNPLEEPPAPLIHKTSPNPGSLQPAHSQRPFQLAGYLIMPASSASSTSALTQGSSTSTISSVSGASQPRTLTSSLEDSDDGKISAAAAAIQSTLPPAQAEQTRKVPLPRGAKRPAHPMQSTPMLPSRVPGAGGPPQQAPILQRSAKPQYGQAAPRDDPRTWTPEKAVMHYQRTHLPETIDLTAEPSEVRATAGWSGARSMCFASPRAMYREAFVQRELQAALAKHYSTEDPHHHSLRQKVGPADSLGHPDRTRAAPPHVLATSKESAFQLVVPATTVPVRLVQDNTIVMAAPGKKSHPDRVALEVSGLSEMFQGRSGEMMPVVPGGSGSSGLSHHAPGQYSMQHAVMMSPMIQSSHVREETKQLQQQQQQHGSSTGYPSHAMYHQSRQMGLQYPSGRQQLGSYTSDQDRRYATAHTSSEAHRAQQSAVAEMTPQGHQQYYASSRGSQPTSHHIISMESMGHPTWPQGYRPSGAPSVGMVPQPSALPHAGATSASDPTSSLSRSQHEALMQRQIQQHYQQQYLQQQQQQQQHQQQQQQRRHSPMYPSRTGPAQLPSSSAHQVSMSSHAQPYPGLHSRPHHAQQMTPAQHEAALLSRLPLHPSVQGYPQPPAAPTKPDVPSLVQHGKQVAASRPAAASVAPKTAGLQPVNSSCAVCRNLAIYLCSNCRNIWYCSGECQTAHWRVHATDCKELV